jgi:hypothetical protein
MLINTVANFDAALESGKYAWPGGYPCFFVCADGEALSFDAAKDNADLIRADIEANGGDWRVVAFDVNWEDTDLYCSQTNEKIESAYGEDVGDELA